MTKSMNSSPNPEPEKPKGLQGLLQQLKPSPKTVTGAVIAIADRKAIDNYSNKILRFVKKMHKTSRFNLTCWWCEYNFLSHVFL
jgi:hypothetical protein